MHLALFIIVILALVLAPGIWVKRVMSRYHLPPDRYGLSGGETARKLLDSLNLEQVRTEITDSGDHYDPIEKAVRLTEQNFHGKSLTAITIAAHEVGHAMQDAESFAPLQWRTRLVQWVGPAEKTGVILMMGTPLIIGITRLPAAGLLMMLGGLLTLGFAVVIHLLTLPTEFDASFRRALPLLKDQDVLYRSDERHARRLLKAAAMTYVSASLMGLLNFARWWAILRR